MMSSTLLNGSRLPRKRLPTFFQLKPFLLFGRKLKQHSNHFLLFLVKMTETKQNENKKFNSSGFRAGTLSLWTSNVFLLEKIKSSHTLKTSFGLQWWWWWWGGGRQQQLGGKKWDQLESSRSVFMFSDCVDLCVCLEDSLLTIHRLWHRRKAREFRHREFRTGTLTARLPPPTTTTTTPVKTAVSALCW